MGGYKWTEEEDARLCFLWGTCHLQEIAKKMKRVPGGIGARAKVLGLGGAGRGKLTLAQLCRETGYAESRIKTALEHLGHDLHRVKRMDERQGKAPTHYAISEDVKEEVIAYLANIPDGQRLWSHKPGKARSTPGLWGVGLKPKCCNGCQTVEKPHYLKGYCSRCDGRLLRQKHAGKM